MKTKPLTTENPLAGIAAPLLAWYRAVARDLPWRKTRDPYCVWLSEIMLQQTRVAAVRGYYERFLAAFPTADDLARASEEDVLKFWEGLGYYSRARNLRKAAELVSAQGFPDTYEGLLKLPGIGEYTAAAIASAAFGRREAAVDGNVLRCVSRLASCRESVSLPATRRLFRSWLQSEMPTADADIRVFSQAMMELGATVCVPNGPPRCGACPLAEMCRARAQGVAASLPVRAEKKPRRVEEKTVFVLLRDDTVALRKRPGTGLLASLWEFPSVALALDEQAAAEALSAFSLTPLDWKSRLSATHVFTHVEWRMTIYVLSVRGDGARDFFWADRAALLERAVPSAFSRASEQALAHLSR
ncbi:MAG: A/G-specific adenine glycosylase [Oscillibacter sp.]|nr:A/G-specific adenine glycosylase [Oscillibacter sp.]